MFKLTRGRPIGRVASSLACAAAVWLMMSSAVAAFPVSSDHRATEVLGWGDFVTGFVDFAVDTFFGAEPASSATFFVTSDVAYDDAGGRLFVADIHNHRILIFAVDPESSEVDKSASYVLGQPNMEIGGTDPGSPFGNANTANVTAGCGTAINACGMHRVYAVAHDPGSDLLFAADFDNNRVLVWDVSSITNGEPAEYVLGQQDVDTSAANMGCDGNSGAVDACGLSKPTDIHVDAAARRLYVADSGNNRVLVYDLSDGVTTGMAAIAAIGQPDLTSRAAGTGCDGSAGTTDACSLDAPQSVAHDPDGRVFVADAGARRVLAFDASAGVSSGMAATAVIGQPDFATATANTSCGGGSSGEVNVNRCGLGVYGSYVEYDIGENRIFVADAANHRVLAFDVSSIEDGEEAVGVLGQSDYVTGFVDDASYGGGTSRTRMTDPHGMAFDPVGDRLFVCDGGNHRVLIFGANVSGTPVVVVGGESTTREDEDGNTVVDVDSNGGGDYTVTFPPGTEPLEGADAVVVSVSEPLGAAPRVDVNATLPPGATKIITMPRGWLSGVCIQDTASPQYQSGTSRWFCGGDYFGLPEPGPANCETHTIEGDPGDNPIDPGDPNGVHDITICLSDDGETIEISGLRHTLIVGMGSDPYDRDGVHEGGSSAGSEPPGDAGGCQLGGRSGGGGGAALLLLGALGLVGRRRSGRARI